MARRIHTRTSEHWVVERDQEGTTLIVVEKQTKHPIGLVMLHSSCSKTDIRLGYMLSESVWGKGLASELIQGLVARGSRHKINSFIGGVGLENKASKRVLEKNGFFVVPQQGNKDEILLQFVF
jgi:RimJ/RimL family protein N-acetyltransferase